MNNITGEPDKKALRILTLAHSICDCYGGFVLPIMPLIAAKLNISLGFVGLILSIASLSSSILQPLWGYISDLISRRFFIISGLIFCSVFISLTGLIHNICLLTIMIFLGNMGVGLFHPQATTYAGYLSGKEINRQMGIFTAWGTIGYAIGPFVSALLVEKLGLSATIYAAIPGIIITYLLYIKLPKIPLKLNIPKIELNFSSVFSTIFNLEKIILILIFIAIVRALVVTSFGVFMPFLWKEHYISVLSIGILLALFSISGGIASYVCGRLSNRVDNRLLLLFSLLPSIPCLFGALYLLKSIPLLSFIMYIMAGLAVMSANSVNIVMGQKAAPKNMGMISGLVGGFSWGVAGLLQTLIGFLAAKFGIIPVLSGIALTPILGAISILYISKRHA